MATVDARGGAAARTVVCRRVTARGELSVFADARSEKIAQVRENASAEMVFWLPRRREQFRIKGKIRIAEDPALRRALWAELSPSARAMFLWPAPGAVRDEETRFPQDVDASEPVADSFAVLLLEPEVIEYLDLNAHPHDRRRWDRADGWLERRLNP